MTPKKIRFRVPLLLGTPALLLLCWVAATRVRLVAQGSTQTHEQVGPYPRGWSSGWPQSLSPAGVPVEATRATVPADNPDNPEKIALGEELFFDRRLSVDGTIACSTRHDPARAFINGRPVSVGVTGCEGQRNAPTILNSLYNVAQFWDGHAKALADQASLPIINPCEMGQPNVDAAVAEIAKFPEYQQASRKVSGRLPNGTDLVRAIMSYERTQFSLDSPFDHLVAGDKNSIGDSAKRGWQAFQ